MKADAEVYAEARRVSADKYADERRRRYTTGPSPRASTVSLANRGS